MLALIHRVSCDFIEGGEHVLEILAESTGVSQGMYLKRPTLGPPGKRVPAAVKSSTLLCRALLLLDFTICLRLQPVKTGTPSLIPVVAGVAPKSNHPKQTLLGGYIQPQVLSPQKWNWLPHCHIQSLSANNLCLQINLLSRLSSLGPPGHRDFVDFPSLVFSSQWSPQRWKRINDALSSSHLRL